MLKKYFGNRFREAKSSERAEAMPAAIITAIVSSILLLSVAGIISVVMQLKSGSEANLSLTTVASNVDVSLRSDVSGASYITASANLVQPVAGQLINQSSLAITGVNLNIPEATGQCKLVSWTVSGTSVTRDLTIYSGTSKANDTVECDINSSVLAHRNKVFANNINIIAPFQFTNAAGRGLTFVLTNQTVSAVNNKITQETAAQGSPLTTAQFNALNSMLNTDSFQAVFVNPSACTMNATPVNGVCPAPESPYVTAAWNTLQIAKVSVNVRLMGSNGQSVSRDIAQNSSVPLYQTAAQAQAAVAAVSTYNQPTAPTPSLSVSPVVLGSPYSVSWVTYGACPDSMTVTYLLYQNGQLINTTASTSLPLTYTDSSTQYVNYTVQQMCTRGAMVVPSPMSTMVSAPVIPAAPSLVINQQPPTSNAALNANLSATGTCLYNTSPRYTVAQTTTTFGTAGSETNLTSVNMAINNGMQVVEGAQYQYQVTSWCVSAYASSSNVSASTNTFTTVINAPAAPTFTSPVDGSTDVSPTVVLSYGPVTCAVGTTVAYSLNKTMAHTAITPIQIETWGTANTYGTSNYEGYKVQYNATAECKGTAVTSVSSPTATTTYITHVNSPNSANAWNNGWTEVYWNAVSCAPMTTPQYRVIQTKADNNNVWFATGWTSGTQSGLPGSGYHTGGYPQWAHVEAYCLGADAVSTITGGTTTKWVENFTINFNATIKWRRLEVSASCPYATNLSGNFSVYVAADGWNGTRYAQGIGTDDGNTIASSGPGGGGNSGWTTLNANQNWGWLSQWNGTWGWGYWGQQGWASDINGTSMIGTYWNASAWGNYAYWWYGSCSSPYMTQTAKGTNWYGGGIRNLGNPYLTYNAVGGTALTAAGQQAIQ